MPNDTYNGTHSAVAVRVYRVLRAGARPTKAALAVAASTTVRSLDAVLRTLHGVGLARIVRWDSTGSTGLRAVYGYGPGAHAPRRLAARPSLSGSTTLRADILHALAKDSMAQEVAARIGRHPTYVAKVMRDMANPGKYQQIHVVARLRNYGTGGAYCPIYRAGPGKNAPPPQAMSGRDLNRRFRARVRADYPSEIAAKILTTRGKGGILQYVQDGRTVYRRREPRDAAHATGA